MLPNTMFHPENAFYREFDVELFDPDGRGRVDDPHRSPFEIDRDRIVHAAPFRRLQGKTQVLLAGEYDFYRTRLTHSIEVAQLGRAICTRLLRTSPHLNDDFHISPDLVEAACLAHDLGHPPFGHAGERVLNDLLCRFGGFEGNAQTLRILTRTAFEGADGPRGIRPTRALIDAVLKYKVTHGTSRAKKHHFVYDEQRQELDFVFQGGADQVLPQPEAERNAFRSIECQIMNWADDVAYSVHDVSDGIHAGFITLETVERWAEDAQLDANGSELVEDLLRQVRRGGIESFLARRIGRFVQSCSLVEVENVMSAATNRYRFALAREPEVEAEYRLLTSLAASLVFSRPQITQLEAKGDFMLRRIFALLDDAYGLTSDAGAPAGSQSSAATPRPLLPQGVHRRLVRAGDARSKVTIVRDYLAGMTDAHAIRFYRRLFDPTFGSLTDLV